jgi:hypothetical protein
MTHKQRKKQQQQQQLQREKEVQTETLLNDIVNVVNTLAKNMFQYNRNTRQFIPYSLWEIYGKDVLPRVDANEDIRMDLWQQVLSRCPTVLSPSDTFPTEEDKFIVLYRSLDYVAKERDLLENWNTLVNDNTIDVMDVSESTIPRMNFTRLSGLECFHPDPTHGDPTILEVVKLIMKYGVMAVTVVTADPVPKRAEQIRAQLKAAMVKANVSSLHSSLKAEQVPILSPTGLFTLTPKDDEQQWFLIVDQAHVFGTRDNALWCAWAARHTASGELQHIDVVTCMHVPSPALGVNLTHHLDQTGRLDNHMAASQCRLLLSENWHKRIHVRTLGNLSSLNALISKENPIQWLVRVAPSAEARGQHQILKKYNTPTKIMDIEALVTLTRLLRAGEGCHRLLIAIHEDIASKLTLDDWLIILSYFTGGRIVIILNREDIRITQRDKQCVEDYIEKAYSKLEKRFTPGPTVTCNI